MINGWDLFNVLKLYTYEQLKNLDIVLEIGSPDIETIESYATNIEEYDTHIRIS